MLNKVPEVEETKDAIVIYSFSKAMKELNVQDLDQLKKIEFSNEIIAHREILNYLTLSLPKQKITTERDWANLGFKDSSDLLNFFNHNKGILLSLEVLFINEFEEDLFESKNLKQILSDLNQLNRNAFFENIKEIQEFFVMILSAYKKIKISNRIEYPPNAAECLNDMILHQIKGL